MLNLPLFSYHTYELIMHLSILRPTTPHPGYIGGKVGRLPCFDTKTCPICGEFDHLSYACATNKAPTKKFPIFSSIIEWGEGWDLTDLRAQWVVHLNFAKFKSPPIPQHYPGGG